MRSSHTTMKVALLSSTKDSRIKLTKTERPAQPKLSKETTLGITNLISFSLWFVMSLCVADGILVPRPGKIRLNLYLLHWEHIVWLTTGSSGKFLLLFFSFGGFLPCLSDFQVPWSNFDLHEQSIPWSDFDTTWMLHQQTITGWKRTLHSTYCCHPTLSISNTRPDSFFRAGGMLKEGSRERILRTGSSWWVCPPKYCWVHLLVSAVPSVHLSSTSITQARWGVFSLLENRGNPAFTPAQWFSTMNCFRGYLTNNVWTVFLSRLREEVTAAPSG